MTQDQKHRNQTDATPIHFVTKTNMEPWDVLRNLKKEQSVNQVWNARVKCAQSTNKKEGRTCAIAVFLTQVWLPILSESKERIIVLRIFSTATRTLWNVKLKSLKVINVKIMIGNVQLDCVVKLHIHAYGVIKAKTAKRATHAKVNIAFWLNFLMDTNVPFQISV